MTLLIFLSSIICFIITRSLVKSKTNSPSNLFLIKFFGILALGTLSTFIVILIKAEGKSISYQKSIRTKIDNLTQNSWVILNKRKLKKDHSILIINEIKSLRKLNAHHSHPTDYIRLKFIEQLDTLDLLLRTDSQYDYEYWVYTNDNNINSIGRIRSEKLRDKLVLLKK